MEKRKVPLVYERSLCNECIAQPHCSIGQFAAQFVRKNLEEEVDFSKRVTRTLVSQTYDSIYIRDKELKDRFKQAINEEIDREFERYNEFSIKLDVLVTITYNAQELGSENLIRDTLDEARQDFLDFVGNTHIIPTVDELISMSMAAKEWRGHGVCMQDLIQP
jgi:hypothetical protein